MSSGYEVLAVRYGTRETTKSACYLHYSSYGEPDAPYTMDYFFWVLRNPERTVLVDTGFAPAVGERRGRTTLVPPVEALGRIGVRPEDVSLLVLTHLHYDHTGNVAAFPHAEVVVPRRELEFWAGAPGKRQLLAHHVEADELAVIAASPRKRLLEGSGEIAPGIEAIQVGGHSPGQLVLVIEGRSGPVVLSSDAIHYYEELERDRPFEIVVDLERMYAGFDILRDLAALPGAVLVAGHDPLVMERFPAVAGAEGIAVRAG